MVAESKTGPIKAMSKTKKRRRCKLCKQFPRRNKLPLTGNGIQKTRKSHPYADFVRAQMKTVAIKKLDRTQRFQAISKLWRQHKSKAKVTPKPRR